MRARRLILIVVALTTLPALADDLSASAFVTVAKRDISGKTGRPEKSVEISEDGTVSFRNASGAMVGKAELSPADLAAFQSLLSDRGVLAKTPDCPVIGADLPQTEFSVEYAEQTLTVRVPADCSLPPRIKRLRELLREVEQTYLGAR